MKSILVVEDEFRIRKAYADAIQEDGYAVTEAELASTALRLTDHMKPDLIVLDIMMPRGEMDGIEFLSRLHEKGTHTDTPILVVSGLGGDIDAHVTTRLGVRGVLTKPFPLRRLIDQIRRIVGPSSDSLA